MIFEVLDASSWEIAGQEQEGVTEHPWLRNPDDGELHLWKPARGRRWQRREHWAEKVASEVAQALGIPCAHVELAAREGVLGCLSRDLQGRGYDRHSGAMLLAGIDSGFEPTVRGHDAYRVKNIFAVLQGVAAPRTDTVPAVPRGFTAFDVFAGYLAFDALILNRDRHAANWSVLRRKDGTEPDRPCALYDNASSLAMSMSDGMRSKRLRSGGVGAYAEREDRARAFAAQDGAMPHLVQVAKEALRLCSPHARDHWLDRLAALEAARVGSTLDSVPGMSDPLRTFTVQLVGCNQGRLARACSP